MAASMSVNELIAYDRPLKTFEAPIMKRFALYLVLIPIIAPLVTGTWWAIGYGDNPFTPMLHMQFFSCLRILTGLRLRWRSHRQIELSGPTHGVVLPWLRQPAAFRRC